MNRIIVPTGYMGSGSSAITDLLSEIDGFDADHGAFEYVFLHCPNGVFDLEDKLLVGNNALRSDEALRTFRATMKQLFDKKYWWVGHYNVHMCPRFMEYTEEYIQSLIQYRPDFYWYWQENADAGMICKLIFKRLVELITFRKVQRPKPLVYENMAVSYVDAQEFYEKTRCYLDKLWSALGLQERNLILDQLLLPFNLHRAQNYFPDGQLEVFVIDRDPRDMFVINKYICAEKGGAVPYPTDAYEFCKCYRSLRQMEKETAYPGIHRIHFEDLVYGYDNTVTKIYDILHVTPDKHSKKGQIFDPARSIDNTQMFLAKPEFQYEGDIIARELPEYLYSFPYERIPDSQKSF